jgi:hypothetical protein
LQSLFPRNQTFDESSMHNVGSLLQGIITNISLKPKLKTSSWSISHLSLCNICGLHWYAPLLFQNFSNPSCLVRFGSLISFVFKVVNTLSNSVSGAMESLMQIRFIQQSFARGFIDELLPRPSYWEGTGMIWILCGKT